MLDHDLDTAVLRRVLALKQFALFDGVELAELSTIAQNTVEVELAPGELVARAGDRLSAIDFVVSGSIATGRTSFAAREVFGALHLFADRAMLVEARAVSRTRTLRLDADDLRDILEDNFGVLVSAIRTLAERSLSGATPSPHMPFTQIDGPLGLVDRLLLLRRQPAFSRARLRALTTLAHASHEVDWAAGITIAHAGDVSQSAYVIVEGTIEAGDSALQPGDAFGLLETLTARPLTAAIETTKRVRALASPNATLLDVLEDHTDLGLAMLSTLSQQLIDRYAAT